MNKSSKHLKKPYIVLQKFAKIATGNSKVKLNFIETKLENSVAKKFVK